MIERCRREGIRSSKFEFPQNAEVNGTDWDSKVEFIRNDDGNREAL